MVTPSGALALPSKMNSMQRRRSSPYLRKTNNSVFVIGDYVPGPDKYESGMPNFKDVPSYNQRQQKAAAGTVPEYNGQRSYNPQTGMGLLVVSKCR